VGRDYIEDIFEGDATFCCYKGERGLRKFILRAINPCEDDYKKRSYIRRPYE